jgi:hypothetical protein
MLFGIDLDVQIVTGEGKRLAIESKTIRCGGVEQAKKNQALRYRIHL